MSSRGADRAFVFSEMGVVTKILAQAWDSTWKSEVPAGANKIEDVQTSWGAGARFFQNAGGSKSFRSASEHEMGK